MSTPRRVQQHPAFLLHNRPFRDTSLLLDIFSREHGRFALVARGARSQKSRLKPLLRPFMPLRLSWLLRSDLGTLTGAELDGPPLTLSGDALMSGYYVNELIDEGGASSPLTTAYLAAAYQAVGNNEKARQLMDKLTNVWPKFHVDLVVQRVFRYPEHAEQVLVQLRDAGLEPVK